MFKAEEPMQSTEQAPTEEQKEAYNKAVNDYAQLV
jgi:hypothetical protein